MRMKMPTDLFILEKLETVIEKKLEHILVDEIASGPNGFSTNESENIIGLNLDSLKFRNIDFLKNLKNLKELVLRNNQICDITTLGNLRKLTYLDLSENSISETSILGCLSNLTHLILRRNKITNISFLKSLRALNVLDIGFNKVHDVSCLKNLHNLKKLDLDFNWITDLPKEIAFLEKLEYLSMNGNPLERPPYGIANAGIQNIQNFFLNELSPKTGKNKKSIRNNMKRKKIFICYSHSDTEWLKRVQTHLSALEDDMADIDVWDDTQIRAGMKWETEIAKALSEAKISVLLISADFLASDFIKENELPPLLDAAREKGTVILPLILKPSRFEKNKNLSQFQAINPPANPLILLDEGKQEEILVKLVDRIEEILSNDDTALINQFDVGDTNDNR